MDEREENPVAVFRQGRFTAEELGLSLEWDAAAAPTRADVVVRHGKKVARTCLFAGGAAFPFGPSELGIPGEVSLKSVGEKACLAFHCRPRPNVLLRRELASWLLSGEDVPDDVPPPPEPQSAPSHSPPRALSPAALRAPEPPCAEPPRACEPREKPAFESAGVVIENPDTCDVFPYVVTSRHARGRAAPSHRLLRCPNAADLPLFSALSASKAQGGLKAMIATAAAFQSSPDYVGSLSALEAPWSALDSLHSGLARSDAPESTDRLGSVVLAATGQSSADLLANGASELRDRLWQSVWSIALSPPASSSAQDRDSLVAGLRMIAFLEAFVAGGSLTGEGSIRDLLSATPVFPDEVAPPRAQSTVPGGWAELLGVGDLKVIRQRLLRYDLGEIAFTVNLLPHERRVSRDRAFSQARESDKTLEDTLALDESGDTAEGRSELQSELCDLIAAQSVCRHFEDSKTYGNDGLSFTGSGTGNGQICPSSRTSTGESGLAERLTRFAASRIARRAKGGRQRRLLEEKERIHEVTLDNSASVHRQIGIYRWLRKIYDMSLAHRGSRLVAELSVPCPSAAYLSFVDGAQGEAIAPPPVPPIGSPANMAPYNYRQLAAMYRVEIPPPPEQTRVLTASFQKRGSAGPGAIVVPEGYQATAARVSVVFSDGRCPVAGLVGDWAFEIPAAAAPAAPAPKAEAADPSSDCPPCKDPFTPVSPNVPGDATLQSDLPANAGGAVSGSLPIYFVSDAPDLSASVAVTATRIGYADAYTAWQITAYDILLSGYRRLLAEYQAARSERVEVTSRDRRREIEQRSLKDAGMSILWNRRADDGADQPAYFRFFDRAFEWREMAYQFYSWGAGAPQEPSRSWPGEALVDPESDALFQAFLRAQSSRVVAPISPGEEPSVLFYFLYGALPPWSRCDVPVAESDTGALTDLWRRASTGQPACGDAWTIDIPTCHLLLQDDCDVPAFAR